MTAPASRPPGVQEESCNIIFNKPVKRSPAVHRSRVRDKVCPSAAIRNPTPVPPSLRALQTFLALSNPGSLRTSESEPCRIRWIRGPGDVIPFLGAPFLLRILVASCRPGALAADPAKSAIRPYPTKVELLGPDSVQQIAVDLGGGRSAATDRTASATFSSADTSVVDVDSTGLIIARGDGDTVVTDPAWTDARRNCPSRSGVSATRVPAMNFGNQVVPVFTKLGCNSGGCHGKASGQNGFRLSLLGFEPALDYETLVKEGRGRRLFPAMPARSLLLEKAIGRVPHGGGRRMEEGSHEYRVILRWVEAGMPLGRADDPVVERIAIYPEARRLAQGGTQQIGVTAYYSDGRAEDVTRWAQYQSNDARRMARRGRRRPGPGDRSTRARRPIMGPVPGQGRRLPRARCLRGRTKLASEIAVKNLRTTRSTGSS